MTRVDLARLSDVASGVPSGTSFPGSPATNDLFRRTDRGLIYFWDGTRWLSETLYQFEVTPSKGSDSLAGSDANYWRCATWNAVYDLWLVDFQAMTFVATTNTSGAFWTVTLSKESKAAAYSLTTIVSFTTGSGPDTADRFTVHTVSINALLGTSSGTLNGGAAKTSTPGALTAQMNVTYRLVG